MLLKLLPFQSTLLLLNRGLLLQLLLWNRGPLFKMTRISELKHGCCGSALEIRIVRKWIPHYRKFESWYLAVDKNGDSVAMLGQNDGQKFLESILHVNKCYEIEKYSCSDTPRHQRVVKNSINLNLGPASKITAVDDIEDIPRFSFDFVSFDKLNDFIDKPQYYPDIIGKYKKKTPGVKKDGDPLLYITIIDAMGQEALATLWKECIENQEKFNKHLMTTLTVGTLIAITNVKPTLYGGRLRLSSTDATHVISDPELIQQFSLMEEKSLSNSYLTVPATVPSITIEELLMKSHSYLRGKTICVEARIVHFDCDDSWFLSVCEKCKVRIPTQGNAWFCTSHGVVQKPLFFFSLHVVLDDGTKTVRAMATDAFIKKLTRNTCEKYVLEDGYDDRKSIPPDFEAHKTSIFKFSVEMTRRSTANSIHFVIVDFTDRSLDVVQQTSDITSTKDLTTTTSPVKRAMIGPPPMTPDTDVVEKNMQSDPRTDSQVKTSVVKRLDFHEKDDIDKINPTKRRRYED